MKPAAPIQAKIETRQVGSGPPWHSLKLSTGHHRGTRRERRQDDSLIILDLPEHQETALAQNRDARQRGVGQPISSGRDCTRPQAMLLGATQHLGNSDRRGAQLMTDLLRVRTGAMESQQHNQRGKALIKRLLVVVLGCHSIPSKQATSDCRH
jgi:hypothetical protein